MPRYKVDIHGERLDGALVALKGAGVPTIGPTFTERPGGGLELVGTTMHAIVNSFSPDQAEARVRDALPADGDFTVDPAEPFPPEDE